MRLPPLLTETATEKLMMLSLRAVMRIYVDHMRLRAMREEIDFALVEEASDELRQIAWEAERKQKGRIQ